MLMTGSSKLMILNFKIKKMKSSKLIYYLLAILCIMTTSCVTDGVMDDCPDSNKSQVLVKDAHVNFTLTFPANSVTRANDNGSENERAIDNVHVYTFQNDKFVEEIKYVVIDGQDGDINRNIDGTLQEAYLSNVAMEFVVIVNAENKDVNNISINKGSNKEALYKQLLFNFNKNKNWSKYIPMWGIGTIQSLKAGTANFGTLDLIRAVAKINVTVADGEGIKDFEITEIQLHNYNTQGYCAPLVENAVSIPANSEISTDYLTSGELSNTDRNKFENKFYIPEHKNTGISDATKQVKLKIMAKVKGNNKVYTIDFNDANGNPFDVYRNSIYKFNITSVKMDIDVTSSLTYEVKKWEHTNVNVPSFN